MFQLYENFFPLDRQKNKHHVFAFTDLLPREEPYQLPARDVGITRLKKKIKQPKNNCCKIIGSFQAKETSFWRTSGGQKGELLLAHCCHERT